MFDGPWESCMLVRGLNPSECASWVQAWGAVFAIAASAAVVMLVQRAEARRDAEARNAEEIRLLKIVGQFVFEVRAKLRDIDYHPIPYLHSNWMAIEAPIACIRATPFDRYPANSAAFAVASALVSYDFMREPLESLPTRSVPQPRPTTSTGLVITHWPTFSGRSARSRPPSSHEDQSCQESRSRSRAAPQSERWSLIQSGSGPDSDGR